MMQRKEKRKKENYLPLIIILSVIVIGIVIFLCVPANEQNESEVQDDSNKKSVITKHVETSTQILAEDLKALGELVTYEYAYTLAETFDSSQYAGSIKLPLTKTSFIYTIDGNIKAGIDFTDITVTTDKTNKRITIRLPEAMIISSELDHDSFQVVDETGSIFNQLKAADVNMTFQDVKQKAEARAKGNGVLEKAAENAQKLVGSFVKDDLQLCDYAVEFE